MGRRTTGFRRWSVLLLAGLYLGLSASAWAQDNDNGGGGIGQSLAGVAVDAQNVLRMNVVADPSGMLTRQRLAAAKAALAPEVAKPSPLRKVSLNRLEAAIIERQGVPTEEMRYLAGLLRVQYVFFYPESRDIVLAGPAEGWANDPVGRVIGMRSGRPVLQLQDLAVALRAFPPGREGTPLIGCSIDPTQEGLAMMQQFLQQVGRNLNPANKGAQAQYITAGLRNSLGYQDISVNGVSPATHFAQVLVEADYRMKLIGIGLERPPVKMATFIENVNPAAVSRNALFRWFFVPDYECVRVSEDGAAMELVGDGVKLVGEDEMVSQGGERKATSTSSRASQAFVSSFTKKYPDLASRSPVYAELRNLIDLSVAAAFIQQHELYTKAGWTMPVLGDEKKFAVETYRAPQKVEPVVTAVWSKSGNTLTTPIGGGVQIEATRALDTENLLPDEDGAVARAHQEVGLQIPEGRWWWD